MNKLVLASHATLSKGLLESAKFIIGDTEGVEVVTAYVNDNVDYEKLIKDTVSTFDYSSGKLIIATDITGGSVNSEFMRYLNDYPFYLIAGVNLVTVISLISSLNGNIDENVIRQIVEDAKKTIIFCNDLSVNQNDDF